MIRFITNITFFIKPYSFSKFLFHFFCKFIIIIVIYQRTFLFFFIFLSILLVWLCILILMSLFHHLFNFFDRWLLVLYSCIFELFVLYFFLINFQLILHNLFFMILFNSHFTALIFNKCLQFKIIINLFLKLLLLISLSNKIFHRFSQIMEKWMSYDCSTFCL